MALPLGSAARVLAARLTRLPEAPGQYPDADQMIAVLLADHESLARQLREDVTSSAEKYGDVGTSDFLTGLLETHEKTAWMLRALTRP